MEKTLRKVLDEYDSKYTTLVDYFCLIGASTDDTLRAIQRAKQGQKARLEPEILSRTPSIDKPSIAFPNQVTDVSLNFYFLVLLPGQALHLHGPGVHRHALIQVHRRGAHVRRRPEHLRRGHHLLGRPSRFRGCLQEAQGNFSTLNAAVSLLGSQFSETEIDREHKV